MSGAVESPAARARTRRRVLAAALVAAVGVAGISLIALHHRETPIRALVPPSSSTAGTSTTKNTAAGPTTVVGDSGLLQQFTPTSGSTWWAVVADNLEPRSWVVRTVDSGRHWRNVSPLTGYTGSSSFLNGDDAWIEAGALGHPESEPVYRTLDGGRSWQRLGMVPGECELQFVDQLHGWCTIIGPALGSESVSISRTLDGGSTWTLVSRTLVAGTGSLGTPDAIPFACDKSVTFTSPTTGWAPFSCIGGRPALYQSTDGGSTWRALPQVPFPNLPSGVSTDSGSGFGTPVVQGADVAIPINISGRPGATAIATSSDGGMTWRTRLVPDPTKLWSVDLIDPTHWRLADGTVFMATNDAGDHWRRMTPSVVMKDPLGSLFRLQFLSPGLGWAIPGPNGGLLSWTTDGGSSWKPITLTAGPYSLSQGPTG